MRGAPARGGVALPGPALAPRGNRRQAAAFLAEAGEDSALHREQVGWFLGLPLWAEHAGRRFVHACWHAPSVAALAVPQLPRDRLEDCFAYAAGRPAHPLTAAVETLLKGPETDLPPGVSYLDPDGIRRRSTRLAWWRSAATMAGLVLFEGPAPEGLEAVPAPAEWAARTPGPRTYIGHYWMRGEPAFLAPDVCCVDWSVAKGGVLAAWREEEDGHGAFITA